MFEERCKIPVTIKVMFRPLDVPHYTFYKIFIASDV